MGEELSFHMTGSGSWGSWFPEGAGDLYYDCYRSTVTLPDLTDAQRAIVAGWESVGFASVVEGRVTARCPILTPSDLGALECWFAESAGAAARVVGSHMDDYRALAARLTDGRVSQRRLLAVLVYAQTLDVGTLTELQERSMGAPPRRADSGSYFFWGHTVSVRDRLYYGVNSFGTNHFSPAYIWSYRFERRAESRKSTTIPVFDRDAMRQIRATCGFVAGRLGEQFRSRLGALGDLLPNTTFAGCDKGDTECMLFHWGHRVHAVPLGIWRDR